MLDPSLDQLIEEAQPLGYSLKKLDDRHVIVERKGTLTRREFECWIARERVRQALVKAGGLGS